MADLFFQLPTYLLFVIIFFLIFFFNGLGFRYKKRQISRHPGAVKEGMGSIEGSMLGVMSLLMGFSFSVAVTKFEARRNVLVEETNYIGTAILRCDLYPDTIRVSMRSDFKDYLETRIAYYEAVNDEEVMVKELEKGEKILGKIWETATLHSNDPDYRVRTQLMIPVLNEVLDIVNTRDALRISRVPPLILWTLLILVLAASFLLGTDYNGYKRNIMLLTGYALVMTLTLNLINELNHPRQGLVNLDNIHAKMVKLREAFH